MRKICLLGIVLFHNEFWFSENLSSVDSYYDQLFHSHCSFIISLSAFFSFLDLVTIVYYMGVCNRLRKTHGVGDLFGGGYD